MISIITPVYNGERFIESCIQNVIEQDCPSAEHVIVDGNSTDRTVEIIRRYAEKYSHIQWVSEKDGGQSDAMNKGIAMAKGEIVGFLNVDDYYEPKVLNRVLEIFENLPEPGLLVGNCNVWNDNGTLWFISRPSQISFTNLLLEKFSESFPENPSAYFYHKSLHQKIGLYKVDEDFGMDLDFILKAVQVANVKYVDRTLGNYRFLEGTKTFRDVKSGNNPCRVRRILRNFRKKLPLSQRLKISLLCELYKNGWRLKYCLRKVGLVSGH